MSMTTTLLISSDADVITARLQARKVARSAGFGTIDQARISLAASELARLLIKNQAMNTASEISISETQTESHAGIQLIGLTTTSDPFDTAEENHELLSAIQLVDEYLVENHDDGIRVTLMKWLS